MTLVRPPEFSCRATVDHGDALVTLCGELDLSTAAELSDALAPLLERRPRSITVDLAGLEFIDSTGLTLIVRTSKRLREHDGALRLASPTPPVRRVLELVGLDALLVASRSGPAWAAMPPVGPARMVPVPAQLRRRSGDDDQMTRSGDDVLVAPRAEVRLAGLVRLHGADLQLVRRQVLVHGFQW